MTTQPKPFYVTCADLALHAHAVENAAAKLEQVKQEADQARNAQVREAERLNAIAHKETKTLTNELEFMQLMGGSADELRPVDARAAREFQQVSQAVQVPSVGVNELPLERESVSQLRQAISYAFDNFREAMLTYKTAVRFQRVRRQGVRFGGLLAALIAVTAGISLYSQAQQTSTPLMSNSEIVFTANRKLYRIDSKKTPILVGDNRCARVIASNEKGTYHCTELTIQKKLNISDGSIGEVRRTGAGNILDISQDGSSVAFFDSARNEVRFFGSLPELDGTLLDTRSIALSADGKSYAYANKAVDKWYVKGEKNTDEVLTNLPVRLVGIEWSNQGDYIALFNHNAIVISNIRGSTVHTFRPKLNNPNDPYEWIRAIAWSPDDRYLAYISGRVLNVFEVTTGRSTLLYTQNSPNEFGFALAWGALPTK
jgi:hypothetical protein